MAAQPPFWGQPPQGHVPDDAKPWYRSNAFIVAMVSGVLLTILGAVLQQLIKDDPPLPTAASSDRATLLLDAIPAPSLKADKLTVSGAGWNGDNTVTITFPLLSNIKGRERTTVDGTGRFTVSMGVTVNAGETYEVTATGEQTGTTVTETFNAF
jgi:hypothetical protein